MKELLFVLLAMVVYAAAMAPFQMKENSKELHEVNSDEVQKLICEPHTPCAWSAYHHKYKSITQKIVNNYCVCEAPLRCLMDEDDTDGHAYVHHCRAHEKEGPWTDFERR